MYVSEACGIALLLLTLSNGAAAPQEGQQQRLTIHFPREIKPETITMESAVYGNGLVMRGVKMQEGVYDYSLEVAGAKSLKLLIYCPGYKMAAAEFKIPDLTMRPFVPSLEKLPTTRLKGRLVDFSRQGLPGRTLFLNYSVLEAMHYFGYVDGPVPIIEVTKATTDADGRFVLEVPTFTDDPFFQKYNDLPGEFQLSLRHGQRLPDETLRPNRFASQMDYADSLTVIEVRYGILSGKLGQEFFQQNNLKGDLTPYIRSVDSVPFSIRLDAVTDDGKKTYNANLTSDGKFEVGLPPGKYDLDLVVLGPGFRLKQRIAVEKGIVIEEDREHIVTRP